MTILGINDLRDNTNDLISRAKLGEVIIIAINGVPSVRLAPVCTPYKRTHLTKEDLLAFPLADPGLRDDLAELERGTTDTLGPIQ